jgi:hypothetical protein
LLAFTTLQGVVILSNIKAESLLKERRVLSNNSFLDMVIWRVPQPLPGCSHRYKYRLAFVVNGDCILRFDSESGKGDHKHAGKKEVSYNFETLAQLVDDFLADVDQWRQVHEYSHD